MRINSARLKVKAHGTQRFVIAVKRVDEAQYRYWVATDLSWRTLDIVGCHTFRWRLDVFFADWTAGRRRISTRVAPGPAARPCLAHPP